MRSSALPTLATALAVVLLDRLTLTSARLYHTNFPSVTWDDDNWCLINTLPDQGHYQSRINLANGYIGINLASIGPFYDVEQPVDGDVIAGWPLFDKRNGFATLSGFWDLQPKTNSTNYPELSELGWESVISGIPHWAGLYLNVGGHVLNASTNLAEISNFRSTWNYRDGIVNWNYTWTPPSCASFDIDYSIFLNKLHVTHAAVQLKVMTSEDTDITVADALNGDAALRADPHQTGTEDAKNIIWTSVTPNSVPNVTAFVYSSVDLRQANLLAPGQHVDDGIYTGFNTSSVSREYQIGLSAGQVATIEKHVGIASADAFSDPQRTARHASVSGQAAGFDAMLEQHKNEWALVLSPDSVDNFHGPDGELPDDFWGVEHQVMSIVNTYYLLQNTVSDNAIIAAGNRTRLHQNGISVCGLSSDCYGGKLFWDQDLWMHLGLVNAHPSAARQISDYRLAKFDDAKRNIQGKYLSSQASTQFAPDSAIFPWTSARYGNTTASGPSFDYEYHINTDIGVSFVNNWLTTGDTDDFEERLFPVYNAIAQTFSDLLKYNESTQLWTLTNATDPDEFANQINNPAFTMASVKVHLASANGYRARFGLAPYTLWQEQSDQISLPANAVAGIFLEYDGMNGTIEVKQADVILIDHFLNYPNNYTLGNLDYYASKQSSDGPAMTYSAFSIVALQASPSGCSGYTYDVWGSEAYVRAPFFQYSEQLIDDYAVTGFHPSFPFLTGVGGANQVALFGYLGLKLVEDSLIINPSLPAQLPQIRYRNFYWLGHAISAFSNQTHTTLTRLPTQSNLATANSTWTSSEIPVVLDYDKTTTYKLSCDEPLVLRNRPMGSVATVPGNLVQCVRVKSYEPFQKGQYPMAAVDGAVSTKWIPASAHGASTVLVRLRENDIGAPIRAVSLDWGNSPAAQFSIALSNSTFEPPVYDDGFNPVNGSQWQYAISRQSVEISQPFVASEAAAVVPYTSNTTNVTLPETLYAARYALLSVWGNQFNSTDQSTLDPGAVGCSVAEIALIGTDGEVQVGL